MSEMWKNIPLCKGKYQISSHGNIRSLIATKGGVRTTLLKTQVDSKGYKRIRISIDGDKRSYKIHRLVASAFIPNVEGKPQVNHMDGDKINNHVSNLEWVDNAENCRHAMETGLWTNVFEASKKSNEKRKRSVTAIDTVTGERKSFNSISDAERELNTKHINAVIRGERSQANGYRFEYADRR